MKKIQIEEKDAKRSIGQIVFENEVEGRKVEVNQFCSDVYIAVDGEVKYEIEIV